ncbi:hypothetical protein BDF21DRAFT_427011 [Thamnidium elegans]|uniref:Uncharacterized protein n=1 Tax=Thamnidium elegans TaxID=101142 RepID=A0A8H7SU19_9FUNG|nr:hypothetical protein INT48_003633 [Thamnidium elegans]KAI8066075.1 hypothetical protein BDF21DRAFT_427011 [Thamnidium elegans]
MAPPPKDYWFHLKYWAYIIPAAYVVSFIYNFGPVTGIGRTIVDYNVDTCEKISGPTDFNFCEDVVLSNVSGVAYTTCDPERHLFNKVMGHHFLEEGQKAKSSDFWRVNYVEVPASIEKFEINKEFDSTSDFHPLGITFDINPDTKEQVLASVNLPHYGDASIEFFTVDDESLTLTHKRTVRDPKIYNPNSIHIINDVRLRADDGTPSFFFTNDHYFSSGFLKKIENYFLYLSNVGFYNARTGKVEKGINGLLFANGITGTDEFLFVAETYRGTIKKYDIQIEFVDEVPQVRLNYVKEAFFYMAVDNLRYVPEKDLVVVAGHPKGIDALVFMMVKDKVNAVKPPSQVDVWDVESGETKTLLVDNGELFTTSTSGLIDLVNSKLIVSSLFDEGLLICDL